MGCMVAGLVGAISCVVVCLTVGSFFSKPEALGLDSGS